MGLPSALKKKAAEANRMANEQAASYKGPQVQEPVIEQVSAPVVTNDESAQTQEVDEPVIEPQTQPAMNAPQSVDLTDWKTRYENLRLAKENTKKQINELRLENAELRRQLDIATAEPKPSPFALSDAEREDMSDADLAAYEKVTSKLEPLVTKQENVSEVNAEAIFFDDVESRIPNWLEINNNVAFGKWLAVQDGYSGKTRQQALNEARNSLDSEKVISLFDGFLRESNSNSGQSNVEVDTNRVGGNIDRSAEAPRIWSNAEVQRFYQERSKLRQRQKGRLTEQQAQYYGDIEADIELAMAEGRVR